MVRLPYPLDEREREASFRFRVYGWIQSLPFKLNDALRLRFRGLGSRAVSSKFELFPPAFTLELPKATL